MRRFTEPFVDIMVKCQIILMMMKLLLLLLLLQAKSSDLSHQSLILLDSLSGVISTNSNMVSLIAAVIVIRVR